MQNPGRDTTTTAGRKVGLVRLTVYIKPGPTSSAMQAAWLKFWRRVLSGNPNLINDKESELNADG